jgi:hypothetical protein
MYTCRGEWHSPLQVYITNLGHAVCPHCSYITLDEGAMVREDFKRELLEIRKRRETGVRGIPAEEVMHKLGLGGR